MSDWGAPIAAAGSMSTGKPLTLTSGTIPPTVPRLVLYAVEGFGKTTIAANMPNTAIIMARGETGYLTLLGEGRVPDCPRVTVEHWDDLLATLYAIAKDPGETKTVALDALGGFERLCHEKECNANYGGDWKDFAEFGRGVNTSMRDWIKLIAAMDAVNAAGVAVLALGHAAIKTAKTVGTNGYDRYMPRLAQASWDAINQWADTVIFGNFKAEIVGGSSAGKVPKKGQAGFNNGRDRYIYTNRSDAYDAKNKYGMDSEIKLPYDHAAAWPTIAKNITFYGGKAGAANTPAQSTDNPFA